MSALTVLPTNMQTKIRISESGCWDWTGALNGKGYSSVGFSGKTWLGHRVSYTVAVSKIPDGLTIDHLCRNKRCVNPEHLEVVSRAENSRRASRVITHCKQGHELAGENLRIKYRARGEQRECVSCAKQIARVYREKVKGVPLRASPGTRAA